MGKRGAATAQIDAVIGKSKKNRKKGKKGRKIGRYGRHLSSQRYKAEQRWLKNKIRRVQRHLKKYPNDGQARAILQVAKAA